MTRMWMVNPQILCKKHLLGEHVEIHMIVGSLNKGKVASIKGLIKKGLVEPQNALDRHDEIAKEMVARGYKHESPLDPYLSKDVPVGFVSILKSMGDLADRCEDCKDNMVRKWEWQQFL